jgi:hypothetical protein
MNIPTTTLRIDAIDVDDQLQPRCDGLSEEHVAALMETPEDWPPIVVAQRQGSAPLLLDGFHRIEAAVRLGYESIGAQVIFPEPGADLFAMAFEFNIKHGRPLTLRDRKAYAAALVQRHPELTDREVGRRAGLNHETVGRLRDEQRPRFVPPAHKPGTLRGDVGLFDPIRFAKATRDQKAIAGYVARLAIALDDPYQEDSTLEIWPDDPAEIARACIAAMGTKRATEAFDSIATDARFMLGVVKAAQTLLKEAS